MGRVVTRFVIHRHHRPRSRGRRCGVRCRAPAQLHSGTHARCRRREGCVAGRRSASRPLRPVRRNEYGESGELHRAAHRARCRVPPAGAARLRRCGAGWRVRRIGSPVVARPRTPQGRARETHRRLKDEFPVARCELDHNSPFQLLAATILSAQCTDARVNMVTPHLFARYPTPEALAGASLADVEEIIRSTGFYSNKARSLVGMAQRLVEAFDSEVPGAMELLLTVPGVGRKTANVVRSVALGLPGLPVDTHVLRLTRRLGITTETDPVKVEFILNAMIP